MFLGDLVDRGPKTPEVLRLVMSMVSAGAAICVPGNHENKLLRKLRGRSVQITHGLAESLAQLEGETAEFRAEVVRFLDGLISHYVLDDGKLVVAHAGMKAELQGRGSQRVRDFALYGETTGETDEFGLPVRYDWAAEYRGAAMVVYGHTPTPEPEWLNRTICIDTGCVFGGRLTALRYPEMELVHVPARQMYYQPARPFIGLGGVDTRRIRSEPTPHYGGSAPGTPGVERVAATSASHSGGVAPESRSTLLTAQQQYDEVPDIEDVIGRRIVNTRLMGNVTVREENAAAALEVISRFAVDPKWLIYLPPTMSPPATSTLADLLEHPAEAFAYYRTGCWRAIGSGSRWRGTSWPPIGATAGRCDRSRTYGSRRSIYWRPKGRHTRTRITAGTWRPLAGPARGRRRCYSRPRIGWSM